MSREELKRLLLESLDQFVEEFPEHEGIDVELFEKGEDVYIDILDTEEEDVSLILKNLAKVLKDNNLMIHKYSSPAKVTQYYYLIEDGVEEIADEIESVLGDYISNLEVSIVNNVPEVKLTFIGNVSQEDINKAEDVLNNIKDTYMLMDESELLTDIDFMDYEEIINKIEEAEKDGSWCANHGRAERSRKCIY